MASTSRRTTRKNMAAMLALGSDSYLLAGGQSVEDFIEVVPCKRPGSLDPRSVDGLA
jgi:hypothetical protein